MALSVVEYDVLWEAISSTKVEISKRSEPGDLEARIDLKYLETVKNSMRGELKEFCDYESSIKSVVSLLKKWEARELNKYWKDEISDDEYDRLCEESNEK
ncbi:MAG: hypothetical protein ACK5LP_10290 [Campylobacteraceae bacterium]